MLSHYKICNENDLCTEAIYFMPLHTKHIGAKNIIMIACLKSTYVATYDQPLNNEVSKYFVFPFTYFVTRTIPNENRDEINHSYSTNNAILVLILAAMEGYYYRIVGGPTPFEGRVEVLMKSSWYLDNL